MTTPNLGTSNFGLVGVGTNVQLGKQGPRFVADANGIEVRDVANATLVNLKVANAIVNTDAVNLSQLQASLAVTVSNTVGLAVPLGIYNGNASYTYTGAVTFTNSTSVTNAIESLNNILSHLVPTAPTNFPTSTFAMNSVGNSPVLAGNSVPDNSGGTSGYTAGASVTRTTGTSFATNNTLTLNNQSPNGLVADLTLTLKINNSTTGTYAFTDATASGTGDNGTHSGIVISSQAAYPTGTPGFWKSFSVAVSGTFGSQGINKFQLQSNEEGNSNILYWVQDNVTAAPTVSSTSLTLLSNGTMAYSSSVPHFGTDGTLTGNLSISNLAGETYYNGSPLQVTGTNNVISAQTYSYSTLGISTPINRQTVNAVAVSAFTINVNGTNTFSSGTISATATNVNNTGSSGLASTIVLVKNGSYSPIDELNIPVSGLGSLPNTNNGTRIAITGDASGTDTPTSLASGTWSSSASLPAYEAAVVAGVLSCNKTNYSTGYFPVGPNLSSQDSTQYFTFAFQRSSVSTFSIIVTGTYAHCWVGLPGITDSGSISPHSVSGAWWDTAVAYNGVGVPGDASNPNAGCAYNVSNEMTGSGGTYVMTLGTQSSTNATGNNIYVRFKLTTGQSITAISIT